MKLLLLSAFLALVCIARSAPTSPSSTSPRVLIFQNYDDHDEVHEDIKPHEDETDVVDENEVDDDEETTTTTTTRRSTFAFPTRNRNMIPSRRPAQTQRTSSIRSTTTTASFEDEKEENVTDYDGDFKYIRDFRKYVQKLMEDIRKIVRNLTGYDFATTTQQQNDE